MKRQEAANSKEIPEGWVGTCFPCVNYRQNSKQRASGEQHGDPEVLCRNYGNCVLFACPASGFAESRRARPLLGRAQAIASVNARKKSALVPLGACPSGASCKVWVWACQLECAMAP